ncbi:disulfide bond formation protein B [Egicoccus sp. AB-alg6-2]|uniref:disulfide bond formation protein B n=1 Tax=Egicoccus sp. AB-alg6-2 TaxID=3242692 RepID=UPI00359ED0C3
MLTAVVERTLALLALVAIGVSLSCLVALVRGRVPELLRELALPLATAVAVVATGGSLYLSEVAGYLPCALCWYQRIAMYPLVVVLGVATLRRDQAAWTTVAPLTVIGAGIAAWHVAVERMPALGSGVCDPSAPCAIRWVEEFGFLTIPTMALIGFVTITLLVLIARSGDPRA